ncbi:MAG: DNA-directed polymerase [Actinoallomurus sp.]|nr:DNA-directed polymerase [Actinoallomurus sp.]
MTSWVLHIDLDQFLAAVEVLRRPELRGLPVIVGGDGDPAKRGVVSTASYEARAYGVHSGLPLRTAARRCPDAVFLPVDREVYEAASAEVMTTLRTFGAVVEVLGWDEAFMAVDGDAPEAVAEEIRRRVREATGLDCSVGIGDNKLRAKLATGFAKPDGVFRLTAETWFATLGDRPTDALWGIGRKTARRLGRLGIDTVRGLADSDPDELAARLGPVTGPWLVRLARGGDSSPVTGTPHAARSRGRETTYQHDLDDWDEVREEVARLARRVAEELAAERRLAARVVVKVRYAPFTTRTRGQVLDEATAEAAALERAALDALGRFTGRRPVRLLGVRAELER